MTSPLKIVGNAIRADLSLGELPRELATEAPDLAVFEFRPIPGRIMGAAFDWIAVLGTTADLLAIGGALWAVYDRIISKRKLKDADKGPALLIQVQGEHHTFVQFLIDDGATEDAFIEEFTRTVSALRESPSELSEQAVIEQYELSESHRRVHVRKNA